MLHIRSTVRNMYNRMSVRKMLTLITPKGKLVCYLCLISICLKSEQLPDGTIQVQANFSIVPQCVLQNILVWMRQGVNWKDIIQCLRPKTVPSGYVYHTWSPGVCVCVTRARVCACACVGVCRYVCMYMYVCMYVCMYVVCMYVRTYVCVCMYVHSV